MSKLVLALLLAFAAMASAMSPTRVSSSGFVRAPATQVRLTPKARSGPETPSRMLFS